MSRTDRDKGIRFEPDERPPGGVVLGCGTQSVVLGITGLVAFPTILVLAAGESDAYLSWAVFCTVAVSGAATMLQASRLGRIGAGHVLTIGPAGPFIGICVAALAEGGPGLLAVLVLISSVLPLAISARLSLFRRLLTPTIVGTVNMLIPVTVLPVVFGRVTVVPEGVPAPAAPLAAAATVVVISVIHLKAAPRLRLWAPLAGVVAGSIVAGGFGLYDLDRVMRASWIGLPQGAWPGLDLDFGPAFAGLLPAFAFLTLIGTIQTITAAVAVQRVSWRRPRAVDYRVVEGAVAADGISKMLCGLGGIMPTQTTTVSVATIELTGVAARRVGIAAGALTIALAFLPKALAVVLAVPGPVYAAYLFVLLALIFVRGMSEVVQGGIDHRKGLIAGLGFWVGVGWQYDIIFPAYVSGVAGGLLANGITAGGLVAILMTLFLEATARRVSRLEVDADLSALPKIREFIGAFAARSGWDSKMVYRLDAASEETLLTLVGEDDGNEKRGQRRLFLSARKDAEGAVLEFVASTGEENIQDRIGWLTERPDEVLVEREVSLRLLRHIASSVRHQQFHETDILTVRVDAPLVRGSR